MSLILDLPTKPFPRLQRVLWPHERRLPAPSNLWIYLGILDLRTKSKNKVKRFRRHAFSRLTAGKFTRRQRARLSALSCCFYTLIFGAKWYFLAAPAAAGISR